MLFLVFQGERGDCGTPGEKGDSVWSSIKYIISINTHRVYPHSELSVILQGPEGPPGQRGPKGEEVEHR